MKPTARLTATLTILLALGACGKDNSATGPDGGGNSGGIAAKIAGKGFTSAPIGTNGNWIQNAFGLVGTSFSGGVTRQISISLYNVTGPGTYSVGSSYTNSATYTEASGLDNLKTWIAAPETGSGTVTITSLDSKGAKGTFSFTMKLAVEDSDDADNISITNGSFNVSFSGTGF